MANVFIAHRRLFSLLRTWKSCINASNVSKACFYGSIKLTEFAVVFAAKDHARERCQPNGLRPILAPVQTAGPQILPSGKRACETRCSRLILPSQSPSLMQPSIPLRFVQLALRPDLELNSRSS